jgi:hypothetical protein
MVEEPLLNPDGFFTIIKRNKIMDKFGSNAYLYLDKKDYFKLRLKYFIIGIVPGIILALLT